MARARSVGGNGLPSLQEAHVDVPQEFKGAGGFGAVRAVIFLTEGHGPLCQGERFLKFSCPGQVPGLLEGILGGKSFNLGCRCL